MKLTADLVEGGNTANAPLHSAQWYVGIPPLVDWQAFGVRNHIGNDVIQKEYNRIVGKIGRSINPQATVGVLPKNIPVLFGLVQTQYPELVSGQEANLGKIAKQSPLRITDAAAVARKALAKVAKKDGIIYGDDTVGFVTLLAQYVFGTFMDATRQFEISKNIPIFLSKADLSKGQLTIQNVNERPNQWSEKAQNRLIREMWKEAANVYNSTKPAVKVEKSTQGAFNISDAKSILMAQHEVNNTADLFTVGTEEEGGVVDRPLGLDPHTYKDNPDVEYLNREIPLEFRAMESVANPDELLDVIRKVLNLLKWANQLTKGS